ncbi:PTS ascorbate transporter subunit IIC [Paenibacillus agricola]|uniref:PTS ascorbate transporter subunit IIC n=1 Tax=Paenibacillus agricola TaxID=2716264 RepID=A0ABX0JG42_9BACL|nr:PTS ascorbate transporter subunit IIC [Paenibacillus agricola]NHN35542.1 PTS ascorbate transporter subunit IIC [Paenibacillus agricola]
MNVSDVWDWDFFWSMFRNFMATASPFVMIPVVVIVVGMLLTVIIRAVAGARK